MADSHARRVGDRYVIHGVLASGGMATVHLGRLRGPVGFSRTVAIKQLLPQYATDPDFVSMFVDEARIAARIQHPNVVPTLDVVTEGDEIFIVMEYVHGETLARLIRRSSATSRPIPPRIAAAIVRDMLMGLHAAHDAKDERGTALGIVHRDVSPQNTIVGVDGTTRLLDFGIAKARGRSQVTREGQVKGKLAYMAPEQFLGREMTRSVDIFSAAVVLWEALVGKRLFYGANEGHVVHRILEGRIEPPSAVLATLDPRFDAIVLRGLAREPEGRYATARDFAQALTSAGELADPTEIGEWVSRVAHESLAWRSERVAEVERESSSGEGAVAASPDPDPDPMLGTQVAAFTVQTANMHTGGSPAPVRWRRVLLGAGALGTAVVVAAAIGVSRKPSPDMAALPAPDRSSAAPIEPIESDAAGHVATLEVDDAAAHASAPVEAAADAATQPSPIPSSAKRPHAAPKPRERRPPAPAIPDRL
jgi:serine/threonine-protein kinase